MQIYSDMCFENPIETVIAFDNGSLKHALNKVETLSKKYYLLGYIRYEAKDVFLNKPVKTAQPPTPLPILYFEAYENFKPYHRDENACALFESKPCISFDEYKKAIETIKDHIAQGNTYEVNYTCDWLVTTKAKNDKEVYDTLLKQQTTPYNAYIKNRYETLLSFSPELFFELEGRKIITKPMKGTIKRGKTKQEDEKNIEFLKNDIKNRAENVMIVDLLRNDLGKIAKTGTVKVPSLFDIETHKTLHQMTSTITAELRDDISFYDIFEAIFPCGSITGAPKISTMEIIDRTETGKRNIYCGAIGFISPEKCVFSVPIRILQKTNEQTSFTYRTGGAIVWDSDVVDEWEETITKASFLNQEFKIVETLKAHNKEFWFATEHFNRMENSAQALGFKFNKEIYSLKPEKDGLVRVLLSKNGDYEIQYKPLLEPATDIALISPIKTDSTRTLLYHKTTLRPWYEKSFEKIKTGEIYDEIFFNEKDELTEGARTNILLQINGRLYTPPLKCGLLNGIMRQKMIDEGTVQEKILYKKDLLNAEKILCINSVRGIKEVRLK